LGHGVLSGEDHHGWSCRWARPSRDFCCNRRKGLIKRGAALVKHHPQQQKTRRCDNRSPPSFGLCFFAGRCRLYVSRLTLTGRSSVLAAAAERTDLSVVPPRASFASYLLEVSTCGNVIKTNPVCAMKEENKKVGTRNACAAYSSPGAVSSRCCSDKI
jgi:hypothetical protein